MNGFRILSGDHIPAGGQNAAAANLTGPVEYDYEYYDDRKPASPFVNPHDPTHQQPELLAGNLAGHLVSILSIDKNTPWHCIKLKRHSVGFILERQYFSRCK